LIGLVVCLAAPVLQKLVVTNRERLCMVCQALVDATEEGDIEALGEHIATTFDVRGIDRDALLAAADRTLSYFHIENATLGKVKIEVTGNRATASFSARFNLITPDDVHPGQPSFWIARFELIDGRWQMIAVDPRRTPSFPFDRLEDLIR
jgi:hypothetical protein